jgi:RNA polymerase sigma factor (sigma-70 family)
MTDWNVIVADQGSTVWVTLWRLLGNRSDVEECFQETFIAAWKLSCRQTVECWPALLCSLATARAVDQLRRRYRHSGRRHSHVGREVTTDRWLVEAASTDTGPVEHAVAAELSERLREALSQLPEKQAEMFSLHVLSGWSHREIGERMRMTDNSVGVSIHRARQRLQELLHADQ